MAEELGALAREIVDSNRYMTLGTADAGGLPWVSPVWYASSDYREFFWVSSPQARHSRNLATRRELGIVIFDSQAPVGAARALYLAAVAEEVAGDDLDRGIGIFSRRSEEQGANAWKRDDVLPPASLRLYRATALEQFVLGAGDKRLPVRIDD